jgi:hypothetical protein
MTKQLNLYLLTQQVNRADETFQKSIVVAESESKARMIHPDPYMQVDELWTEDFWMINSWCDPKDVEVKLLGIARDELSPGVLLSVTN